MNKIDCYNSRSDAKKVLNLNKTFYALKQACVAWNKGWIVIYQILNVYEDELFIFFYVKN